MPSQPSDPSAPPPDERPSLSHAQAPGGPLDLNDAVAAALAAVEALNHAPAQAAPPAGPADAETVRDAHELGRSAGDLRHALAQELQAAQVQLAEMRRGVERAEAELAQAQADLSATRRRYQRLDQEHEELRRRVQKAEMDLPQLGSRTVLLTLLPALDHLHALLEHLERDETLSAEAHQGVTMLQGEWRRALQALDVQTFDAVGQTFDPLVHEVIAQVDEPGVPAGHVVRQTGRAYLFNGKLLRSARVVVSRSPEGGKG